MRGNRSLGPACRDQPNGFDQTSREGCPGISPGSTDPAKAGEGKPEVPVAQMQSTPAKALSLSKGRGRRYLASLQDVFLFYRKSPDVVITLRVPPQSGAIS